MLEYLPLCSLWALESFFTLILAGSCPSFITKSSRDLVMFSLENEDIISIFNWECTLFKDEYSLEETMAEMVSVEKIISPVCLCKSIWSISCIFLVLIEKWRLFSLQHSWELALKVPWRPFRTVLSLSRTQRVICVVF